MSDANDEVISTIGTLDVIKIRIAAISLSSYNPQAQTHNHWAIFLLTQDGDSVRFDMGRNSVFGRRRNEPFDRNLGILWVRHLPPDTPINYLRFWDLSVAENFNVAQFYELLVQKGRQRYRMAGSGAGCRFWTWTVVCDLVDAKLIDPEAKSMVAQYIDYYYCTDMPPIYNPMELGSFY